MTHFPRNTRLATAVSAAALTAISLTGSLHAVSADAVTVQSTGQCPSGYMCVWSGTNYTGSVQKFSASGRYSSIALSAANSVFNNRSQRTYFHEQADGSGRYTCLNPGTKKASLTSWQVSAEAVWLSTTTSC